MRDHRHNRVRMRHHRCRVPRRSPNPFARRIRRRYWTSIAWFLLGNTLAVGMINGVWWLVVRWLMSIDPDTLTIAWMEKIVGIMVVVPFVGLAAIYVCACMLWRVLLLPRWADVIAATGRCAACGYDLTATLPEADGLSVCPECGGAWRVREPSASA